MTAVYYLGVDGGGTKTRFALVDGAKKLVAEAQLGTSYHPDVGLDGVRDVLAKGIAQVLTHAGINATQVGYAFFGLPAYGEDSKLTPMLDALPAAILGHERYAVDNDMVCGWAGSMGAEDGINIVAGTGSIGYGQRQGRCARAGGWGEHFSDEGSAYWIAMQGLNAYSRMSDGRLPKGPMHTLINESLGLTNDLDLCAHIYGANARSRAELAQFSQLMAKAAGQGDEAALRIFRSAGQELAQIAEALRQKLGYEPGESVQVSCSGGAFNCGDLLLTPFRDALRATSSVFELRPPLHEPHYGAALYALKLQSRSAGKS